MNFKLFIRYLKFFFSSNFIRDICKDSNEVSLFTIIDNKCQIGSYNYFGRNCNITKVEIGNYCSVANNVSIGQGEHDYTCFSTSSFFEKSPYESYTKSPCVIENDVWIGSDSIVLRGVTISNGAVVAANSVVTKDVPPFAIVAGVPAKVIKYRFDETNIKRLLDSEWWKHPPMRVEKIIEESEFDV